jgi:hypothetical protein
MNCLNCNKEFITKNKMKKFCSANCRSAFAMRKYCSNPEIKKRRLELHKKWRTENHEQWKYLLRKSAYKHRLKMKNIIFSHYSTNGEIKCGCCGEKEIKFLAVDHINGGGNTHRKVVSYNTGGTNFYRWLMKNNYPKEFQILCFNCNWGKKMNNGICPHKTNILKIME